MQHSLEKVTNNTRTLQLNVQDDDDGDEDFEPPAAEEEEEGEEAGVRRRNIQARELSDLLQDACKQVKPPSLVVRLLGVIRGEMVRPASTNTTRSTLAFLRPCFCRIKVLDTLVVSVWCGFVSSDFTRTTPGDRAI